ncbi:MAG TPA: HEAT repeat domain-containing protein [Thermomicrobiales bacterium]|nr:HEAT repeat domain-containing protein [Thermomicrobiales bacterium]
MSIPTFPVTPVDDRDERLTAALEAFRNETIRAADVACLSDLRRTEVPVVESVWEDLSEAQRVSIVRWISELAEDRVELTFGRFLRLALADPSPAVRQLALGALWEDEAADLPARLMTILRDDPSPDVKAGAAALLGRCVDRVAGRGGDSPERQLLRSALLACWHDLDEAPVVRRRALEAVSAFGADDDIRRAIGDAFDDGDALIAVGAVRAMGRTMSADYFGTILAELASDDAELRYEAAVAAGELGDDRAVPELGNLIDDHDHEVRTAAIMALGRIGGATAARALADIMERGEGAVDSDLVAEALEEAMLEVDPLQNPATR